MREIGGYIELDTYRGKMIHDDGVKLNCGRCALEYIIQTKNIKKCMFLNLCVIPMIEFLKKMELR